MGRLKDDLRVLPSGIKRSYERARPSRKEHNCGQWSCHRPKNGCMQENERRELDEPGQQEGKKRATGKAAAAAAPAVVAPASPAAIIAETGCLDALWTLLRSVPDLMQDAPAAAYHTLTALLSLWQASTACLCCTLRFQNTSQCSSKTHAELLKSLEVYPPTWKFFWSSLLQTWDAAGHSRSNLTGYGWRIRSLWPASRRCHCFF